MIEATDTRQAYNLWSEQYDTNENKTRDVEARALRTVLSGLSFENCLEIGCGTGKNTEWLLSKATRITAVDVSEEMLAKAKTKITSEMVHFLQADVTQEWAFAEELYNLISFSLVLEHLEDLHAIFRKAAAALASGGYVYIGELHPFKQYTGSKARFTTTNGEHVLLCFQHHISDYTQAAKEQGLDIVDINEHFDDNDRTALPRILTLLLKKR